MEHLYRTEISSPLDVMCMPRQEMTEQKEKEREGERVYI